MNDNTGIKLNFGRVLKGVIAGLLLFVLLELLCALLIHKEAVDIGRIPLMSYAVAFISVFTTAFLASGESKAFAAAVISSIIFLAILFCIGLILYRGLADWNNMFYMCIVSTAAAFCAALVKGVIGVRHVGKKR